MLEINNISKIYNNQKGLKNLSVNLYEGDRLAIVGPNGAGKTTALNIIAGIYEGDTGNVLLNGYDTSLISSKKFIGYLEESPYLYEKLSVIDYLNFIWGIKFENEKNTPLYNLLEEFDLLDLCNYKIKELSLGLKQRVAIVSSIMNFPKLIILDESTNALDTKSILTLKKIIRQLSKNGNIIIISSHMLDFIKTAANKIIFLDKGAVARTLTINETVDLDRIYEAVYYEAPNKLLR